MAVWLQVKVCGCKLSLQPIGWTPAPYVTQSAATAAAYGFLWYISVICFCNWHIPCPSFNRHISAGLWVWNYLSTDLRQPDLSYSWSRELL